MKIIKFYVQHTKNKYILILYISVYVTRSLMTLIIPYLTGKLIDILVYTNDYDLLLKYCVYITMISVLRLLISYYIGILYAEIFVNSSYNISRFVINHIFSCPISKTDRIDPAYYNQRISQDAGTAVDFSISTMVGVLTSVIETFIAITVIFIISPVIALITAFLLCAYIVIYQKLKKPLYESGALYKEDQAVYFSKMYEQLHYTRFVKAHSLNEFFLDRLHHIFSIFKKSYMSYQKISILYKSLDSVILTMSQIILYATGGYSVMQRVMTIGSFTLISNYFSKLVSSASFIFSIGSSYQNALISFNRITEILTWEEEKNEGIELDDISSISLNNVSYSYGDNYVLKDVSIEFTRGKMYCIVGANGSGKSTLSHLIIGLYKKEYSGIIKINDVSIEDIDMTALRRDRIGYIEQESLLFTDTIEKNIVLWKDIPLDNYDCVKVLNLLDFVSYLPEGWNRVITQKNNNLSGGEKQRIALARILIKESDVMIFDEPTSSLDKSMVDSLINHLSGIKKNKLLIIITHDEKIINVCDEIISL